MSSIRTQSRCSHCGKSTLHERDPSSVNHVLHLLVTVFLLGLWLPVWLIMAANAKPQYMRCRECGYSAEEITADDRNADDQRKRTEWDDYARQKAIDDRAAAWQRTGEWCRWVVSLFTGAASKAVTAILYSLRSIDNGLLQVAGGDAFLAAVLRFLIVAGILTASAFALREAYF